MDWSMNSGRGRAGDIARDISFFIYFLKPYKKVLTKWGQFEKLKCRERSLKKGTGKLYRVRTLMELDREGSAPAYGQESPA